MKRNLILIIPILIINLFAQNPDSIKQQIGAIKSQPEVYYYGEAEGRYRQETEQEALNKLMSQIYVIIDSEIRSGYTETCQEGYQENLQKILNVYTYGRLQDVRQLDYKEGPIFHVFKYIRIEDCKKIFEAKKIEIGGFLREAETSMEHNQLGIAFRDYYRAAILIESLPEGSITFKEKVYTADKILNRIKDIAEQIDFQLLSNSYEYEARTIILQSFYQNRPVQDLNIYYYDLYDWMTRKTNNSKFVIDLCGRQYQTMAKLELKIDIKEELYSAYSRETELLGKLFKERDLVIYREIPLREIEIEKPDSNYPLNVIFNNNASCNIVDDIAMSTHNLFEQLENEYLEDTTIFTDEDIADRIEKVISNNHVKLVQYPQEVDINKTEIGWEIRQLDVTVSCPGFPTRNETAVIDFDDNGRIYNFCYTINPALHEIFRENGTSTGDWGYRQIAIKFLEDYKTAYTTKNVDWIETLYSDDAIIITGKVVTRTRLDSDIKTDLSEKEVIYFKRTKQEHIARQKELFQKNRFVWLQFDTFDINISPIDKVYGISMKQNYYSSTYNDEGYLFLLIDFRGEQPLIHVRNWQPGEWDLEKQMTLEDFRFFGRNGG